MAGCQRATACMIHSLHQRTDVAIYGNRTELAVASHGILIRVTRPASCDIAILLQRMKSDRIMLPTWVIMTLISVAVTAEEPLQTVIREPPLCMPVAAILRESVPMRLNHPGDGLRQLLKGRAQQFKA